MKVRDRQGYISSTSDPALHARRYRLAACAPKWTGWCTPKYMSAGLLQRVAGTWTDSYFRETEGCQVQGAGEECLCWSKHAWSDRWFNTHHNPVHHQAIACAGSFCGRPMQADSAVQVVPKVVSSQVVGLKWVFGPFRRVGSHPTWAVARVCPLLLSGCARLWEAWVGSSRFRLLGRRSWL